MLSGTAQARLQRELRIVLDALHAYREAIARDQVPASHMETATAIAMLSEAAEFDGVLP